MAERKSYPVLPLRGTVLFPEVTVPIGAVRPGTLRAIEAGVKAGGLVFAVAQKDLADEPTRDGLHTVGVVARIGHIQRGLGGVQLLVQGEVRARSLHYREVDGYLSVEAEAMAEMGPIDEQDTAFKALYREVRERAMELGQKRGMSEEVLHNFFDDVTAPGRFADLVAGYLELPVEERQALLETLAVEERLRRVLFHVQRQIGVLDAQEEI